jgi:stage II sporulation protein AA (anti-sigma F factor antagonist)
MAGGVMFINFKVRQNKLIVFLEGELDHHSAEQVRSKIDNRIQDNKEKYVILDFSKVSFMDSSGIGVVIGRYKAISLKGGKLCIVNPAENVNKIFELAGLFKIINRYKTIGEAINNI